MALPENTTTIEAFIASGSDTTLSYDKLSFIDKMSNGTQISILNTVNDYIRELKLSSVLVKFTDEQFQKYMYKPKLLCYDTYGTPELFFVILLINNIADVKEFNRRYVYMLPKNYMNMLMGYIYNSEYKAIREYNAE